MVERSTQNTQKQQRLLRIAGGCIALLGAIVLLAWHLHWISLIQVVPGSPLIRYNTALAFLLSGFTLLALAYRWQWVAMLLSLLVLLIGGLTLIEYGFNIDLGIDQWLMQDYLTNRSDPAAYDTDPQTTYLQTIRAIQLLGIRVERTFPGRPSPNTAFCFVLVGLALLSLNWAYRSPSGWKKPVAEAITGTSATGIIGISLVALLGYLINLETSYSWRFLTGVSIPTALGLLGLGSSLLVAALNHRSPLQFPRWFALSAGFGVLTATLFLWQALISWKDNFLHQFSEVATEVDTALSPVAGMVLLEGMLLALLVALALHFTLLSSKQKIRLEYLNQDLAQSNSLLRATLEATADGILVLDAQGKKVNFNTRFVQMWQALDGESQSLQPGSNTGSDGYIMPFGLSQLKDPDAFEQVTKQIICQPDGNTFDVLEFKDGRLFERYSYPQWLGDRLVGRVFSFRDVTERHQAETALREETQRQAAVLSIQQNIAANRLQLDAIMKLIVEETHQITHASGAVIELAEGSELVYRAASGTAANHVGLRLNINTSFSGRCLETREILYCRDSETDKSVDQAACRRVGVRSMIAMPLYHQSARIGVLKVFSTVPSAFGERDIRTLQLMAGFLAAEISMALEFEARQATLTALHESEEHYRSVVNTLNEGIVLCDAQGDVWASNASAERILGLSSQQMMGRNSIDSCWQAIHEDGSPFPGSEHPSMITLQTGHPCHGVIMGVLKPDGNLTWISVNSQPLLHLGATLPYAVVVSFTDITERKQAEMLLRQSERRYRAIVEDQTELIARYLPDGTLTFVNKAYCRYFGLARAAIVGQCYEPLIFEDDRQRVADLVNSICLTNPVVVIEHRVTITGKVRWMQWINRGLFDSYGQLLELQTVGRDITERKQAEAALQESEQRLTLAFEGSGDGLWDWNIATGEVYLSPRYLGMLGYAVGDLPGNLSAWEQLVHPDDQPWVLECLQAHIRDQSSPYRLDYRVLTKSGQWKWIANFGKVVDWDETGYPLRMAGVHRDIDDRKQAEQALFHEKELAQVTLQSIGDAVITTDATGNIKYLNPVAESLTGWKQTEVQGLPITSIFNIINETTRQPVDNPIQQALLHDQTIELANHTVLMARNGEEIAIEDSAAPIHDRTGQIIGAVMVFHDVTQTRALSRQLVWQASHDALTGLVNRRKFEQQIEQALSSAKVYQQKHALCYLDLDQFKIVNDTCGHAAGDELLRQVTALLQAQIRKTDTLARLGGDEFGVLLHQCSPEQALRVATAMRECLQAFRFMYQGQSFSIGVSIGLVGVTADSESLSSLLSSADAACYTAKNKGRNRVHVFQPDDEELLQQRGEMQWVARLTHALENDCFCLYYQPIAAITETGLCIDHYEVLLRLRDEQGNLISPMAFIPAAERYNLMHRIDRWVIRSLFSQWSVMADHDQGIYAINLSGASLNDEDFIEFLYEQFATYQVPPRAICFEITETIAIANLTKANQLMHELQHFGCRFALDDFGSGMSSFGYLKNLSVDYLKIDGGFIKNIVANPIDAVMVEAITRIGHVMGIKTIAEFVENDTILERIKTIGVDYAQGYGIAAPSPYVLN